MKKIALLFLLLTSSFYAQNTTLAKVNFEAAEEAFNASNYELTIQKLDKAEEYFGQSNLPMLYLRVISQNKLLQQKPSFLLLQEVQKNCVDFISKYSEDPDAFEKIKEVYNISESWEEFKTEADFDSFIKTFSRDQKREQAIALAKEIEKDYLDAFNNYAYSGPHDIGLGKIEFGFDFDNKMFLITKIEKGTIYYKAFLTDVKEVEIRNKNILIYHNKKSPLYTKMEYITTIYGNVLKDKLLQLIKMLETIE